MSRAQGPSARLLATCKKALVYVTLHREPGPTPTVETAAASLGVQVESIVKSVVFVPEKADASGSHGIVIAIAAGLDRIDPPAVARAAGIPGRLRMATPEEVLRGTGYEAGAVPPVAHAPKPRAVVVDRNILDRDRVYGGGGAIDAMLEILPKDIVRMTGAVVADILRSREK